MAWQGVDLARVKLACAPFGGPIGARLEEEEKHTQTRETSILTVLFQ